MIKTEYQALQHRGTKPCGLALAFALAFTASACSDNDEVTRERCVELRDHVIEQRLATLKNIKPPTLHVGSADQRLPPRPIDVEGHREALTQALGEPYVESCMKTMTPATLKCALAAPDSESVTNCATGK